MTQTVSERAICGFATAQSAVTAALRDALDGNCGSANNVVKVKFSWP